MTRDEFETWQEHNREYLALAVDDVHARIEADDEAASQEEALAELLERMTHAPALLRLTEAFGLGAFERDVVVICFASEVDPRFRIDARPVTIGLLLESLEGAHWSALDGAAPLRRWGIVEVQAAGALADTALRLADDVLRFLMGFDPRAAADAEFTLVAPPPAVVESQLAAAAELARTLAGAAETSDEPPAVELYGAEPSERLTLAFLCADILDAAVATADVRDLPPPGPELEALLRNWGRRGRLTATMLAITGADERDDDPAIRHRIDRALARVSDPLFVSVQRPTVYEPVRPLLRREVADLTVDERMELWSGFVADQGFDPADLAGELAALAGDYRVGARTIHRICLETQATLGDGDPARLPTLLRAGCARVVRARLDPLAERVALESIADVALPEEQARQLSELEMQIRLGPLVSTRWGLGRGRDSGLTALFAGPSGTGKTHAALALARRLQLDLYRIDVSAVLSKYIGETEKNLDRIFDAAGTGGAILLFDEADALFGKRSEVRDSHDRYANLGTAYLLQRIEHAPSPTILTTNLKDALDPAFLRRLDFVIDFPFPAAAERERIWSTIFPAPTPVRELAPDRLSVLAATGGTISNIARRGAFLAAADVSPVEMRHLFESAQRELRKLGRDLSPEELSEWP